MWTLYKKHRPGQKGHFFSEGFALESDLRSNPGTALCLCTFSAGLTDRRWVKSSFLSVSDYASLSEI